MIYTAPKLTRLGSVAGVTASDIKCSLGTSDNSYNTRWSHPNSAPFTHWTTAAGGSATPGQLLGRGDCQWVSVLNGGTIPE